MAERKKAEDSLATAIDRRPRLCSWGANGHGQLGIGSREDHLLPVKVKVEVDDGDAILDVGGGGGFSYILLASGAVRTCGNNDRGQLCQGGQSGHSSQGAQPLYEDTFKPCDVMTRLTVVQLSAGWDFIIALTGDGTVFSWGSNAFGQLGRDVGQKNNKFSSNPGIVLFTKNQRQTQVAAGLRHTLSLAADDCIFAWGHGRRGQLGSAAEDGTIPNKSDIPLVVPISNVDPISTLFAGMYHSGALTKSGSCYLWGCNKYGQCCIKSNTTSIIQTPTKADVSLKEEERLTAVCSGWTHLVARSDSGRLYSWGRNDLGQLGRSCDQEKTHIPGLVDGLESVKKHVCGSEHNLAITNDGCLYSWGWNEHGICATGDEENVPYPLRVSAFRDDYVQDIGCAAGHSFSTCIGLKKQS